MRRIAHWVGLSLVLTFYGCNTVPRPNSYVCVINVQALHQKCYNLLHDFDDNGNLNPKAVALIKPITKLEDLDKLIAIDPDSWAGIKAYIRELRAVNK